MSGSDDGFGDDPGMEAFADEFDRHRKAVFELLEEYMEEEALDDDYVGQLLLDALIRLRMATYGISVERPSVAGLKLDLDRLQKEVVEVLREAKKDAEDFIATVKEARAAAEAVEEGGDSEESAGEESEENESDPK
jgi:hypothetical protein